MRMRISGPEAIQAMVDTTKKLPIIDLQGVAEIESARRENDRSIC